MLDSLAALPMQWGLGGLFLSALLSATLLPGNSELALAFWLQAQPATWPAAVLVATLGNTAGSLTTFWLGGRLRRHGRAPSLSPRALAWLQRHGAASLLLAWLPLIGDGLCLAAGWLNLPPGRAALAILLGKSARYLLIAAPFIRP